MDRTSRRTVGWLVGAAAIIVAAGVVVGVLLNDDAPEQEQAKTPMGKYCVVVGERLQVRISFTRAEGESDDLMRRAADALRDDDRIAELTTQTQAEAYAEFKVMHEDAPEMIELASPDSLPAAVLMVPADGISRDDLAADLEDELTGVNEVLAESCARL